MLQYCTPSQMSMATSSYCAYREKAAKALKGIVNVGAVDADADKQLGGAKLV